MIFHVIICINKIDFKIISQKIKMGLIDELKSKIRINSGNIPLQNNPSDEKDVILVEKSVSASTSVNSHSQIYTAKCKGCREIITLTPRIPEFTCRCGNSFVLPVAN